MFLSAHTFITTVQTSMFTFDTKAVSVRYQGSHSNDKKVEPLARKIGAIEMIEKCKTDLSAKPRQTDTKL